MEEGTAEACLGAKERGDVIADVIGGHGPWQFRAWCALFLASLCGSMHLFAVFPLSGRAPCGCDADEDDSPNCTSSSCVISGGGPFEGTSCLNAFGGALFTGKDETYCTLMPLVVCAKCVFVMGWIASAFATHALTSRFDRRPVSLSLGALLCVAATATAFARDEAVLLALRLLVAASSVGVYVTAAAAVREFVGSEYAHLYALTGHVGWGAAHLLLPLLAWLPGSTWMTFNLALAMLSLLLLAALGFIPESVECYAKKKLWNRVDRVVRAAARSNGCTTDDTERFSRSLSSRDAEELETKFFFACTKENSGMYLGDLLRFAIGLSSSFQYFTLVWMTDWYTRQRGAYFALLGTSEVASAIVLLFCACVLSGQRTWAGCSAAASALQVAMYFKVKRDAAALFPTPLYLAAAFFSSAAWAVVLLRGTSVRPSQKGTSRDAVVMGVAVCCGNLLAAFSDFQKFQNWCPSLLLVSAIPSLIIGVSVGVVPERLFKLFAHES